MCGRYYRRSDKQKIAEAFHVKKVGDFPLPPWDYNVAPTTMQPVIRQNRDTGERELVQLRWGLIPYGFEAEEIRRLSTVNAKAENITKGLWARPFKSHRCLIPASGFYEWKKLEGKNKRPFGFDLANGQMMAFAGLWDAWKEPKKSPQDIDRWIQSYTIITTEANELMAPVHNRMPVILHQRDFGRWLDREITDQPPLDLLRPFQPMRWRRSRSAKMSAM